MTYVLRPLALILIVALAACSELPVQESEDDPVLATAYDKKLYASDVFKIVPESASGPDSALMVQDFINKWIQQQVLLHNAKENLTPEEQDFTRQLEEYRHSLLLYSYESKLIGMNLDTVVTDDEISQYYFNNQDQFELKGNIVKFDYVKLPEKSRHIREFRRMMRPGNTEDSLAFLDNCQKYSTDYWLAGDWVFLQDLLENTPFQPDNEENFLRRTHFTETKDEDFVYMLRVNDFKTTDSIPPLGFEKENIRNIIINSRKLELIEMLRQKDIDEAYRDKQAVIYKTPAGQ